MLVTLQVKHIVPSIHIIHIIEAHGMERLTKRLASEGFLFQSEMVMTLRI